MYTNKFLDLRLLRTAIVVSKWPLNYKKEAEQ